MNDDKCYIVIYNRPLRKNGTIWWESFKDKKKAHEYLLLFRSFISSYKTKIVNNLDLDEKKYHDNKISRLRPDYIYEVIESIKKGKYIKEL